MLLSVAACNSQNTTAVIHSRRTEGTLSVPDGGGEGPTNYGPDHADNLLEALHNAKNGDVITLARAIQADIRNGDAAISGGSEDDPVVLDLNGHTLTMQMFLTENVRGFGALLADMTCRVSQVTPGSYLSGRRQTAPAPGWDFFHSNSHDGAEPCPFLPYSDINVKTASPRQAPHSPLFTALKEQNVLMEEHSGGCVLLKRRDTVKFAP